MKKVLLIGGKGFIGRFLSLCLKEQGAVPLILDKDGSIEERTNFFKESDYIIDCHGCNRSDDEQEFYQVNRDQTYNYASLAKEYKKPYLFLSTIQSGNGTPYGDSKKAGEEAIDSLHSNYLNYIHLPNIYGPTCRPGYNSVIATWIDYAIKREASKIHLNDDSIDKIIPFLYVTDLSEYLIRCILENIKISDEDISKLTTPVCLKEAYKAIHHLATFEGDPLKDISNISANPIFLKRIYGTYLYERKFPLILSFKQNCDERGSFTEIFKGGFKSECQFSLNTINPGFVKGGHYHHHKLERFLDISHNSYLSYSFKSILDSSVEYYVDNIFSIDIPPFMKHSLINKGKSISSIAIWADAPFNPKEADTYR